MSHSVPQGTGAESTDRDDMFRLIEEYKLCCADWSNRDAYVQQKFFNVAVVMFAVVVAVAGAFGDGLSAEELPLHMWGMYAVLFFLLGIYMLIALISTTKDIYYRDGSELLLRRLQDHLPGDEKLGILLSELKREKKLVAPRRSRAAIDNPRKLKATAVDSLGVTASFERFLASRGTYRWIVRFYALVFICCLAGCTICVAMLFVPRV